VVKGGGIKSESTGIRGVRSGSEAKVFETHSNDPFLNLKRRREDL
jgi:hypothetical protein